MTKTFLIATVAALAITAPAAAEGPGGHGKGGGQAAPQQQQRAERAPRQQQAQHQAPQQQRMERAPQQQRAERAPMMRPERQQARQERPQMMRAERQQARQERPQMMQRQQRAERHVAAPQRQQRAERAPQMQRQQRAERHIAAPQRQQRAERHIAAPQRQQRAERHAVAPQRQARVEQRQQQIRGRPERQQQAATFDRRQQRIDNRAARQFQPAQQQAFRQQSVERQRAFNTAPVARDSGWARLLDRAGIAQREGVRVESRRERRADRRPLVMVGQPLDTGYYNDSYVPLGYRATYYDTPNYYYRYDDDYGYLYRVNRYDNVVSNLIPLYGGAFAIGQPIPVAYRSYNVPLAYQSYYYDTPDYNYRYGGGAIYQVDPATQLISAVVALLSGQNLGIGQPLPASYGVYNVPYQYRSRYYDTADNWYRYDDGMIYGVDPRSRVIQSAYPVAYDPYYIGQPMPAAWETYNVPYAYRDIYYDTPDYDYRYANGGIYQVNPRTQLVQALVALVGGQNYAVGQALPASYGVYNVPYQYRSQYYDTDQYNYRYNDGYVYRIDPNTRVINGMYDVIVA